MLCRSGHFDKLRTGLRRIGFKSNDLFAASRSYSALLLLVAMCIALPASAQKTLNLVVNSAESTFDPAAIDDVPSADIAQQVLESPLQYDYFARPVALVARTCELIETSKDGKSFVLRVKPGIFFTPDPAFNGKPRELVAADYVYSYKRLLDPKIASPNYYLLEDKLLGSNEARKAAEKLGRFDYDREIAGLRAIDRYTFRIELTKPDFEFVYNFASVQFAVVAREVVEKYRDERNRIRENMVGTGPFMLGEWKRSSRITLLRNPNYREDRVPTPVTDEDKKLAQATAGKRAPIVDRVVISVIEESLPRVLAFQSGEIDRVEVPRDLTDRVFVNNLLKPELLAKGIRHQRVLEPALNFNYFNMEDAVVGGYSLEKNALRRAILLAYDSAREIATVYKGQAEPAQQLVPPGLSGYDSKLKLRPPNDPVLANALLDQFGYKDCDGDGYREAPGCKPLKITRSSTTDSRARDQEEIWKKSMDAIRIRVEFFKQKWPDLIEMSRTGKLQMWGWAWYAGGPGGDGFASLLVSRNVNAINDMQFKNSEYDRLYDEGSKLPLGRERDRIYRALSQIAAGNSVLDFGLHTYANDISQPWLLGYKRHPFWRTPWKYVDVDETAREAAVR
jgi:oligopeptide transport system substrate-binding protein